MELIYARIRERARQIVLRFPTPDFYKDFPEANYLSKQFFETDPIIKRLHSLVADYLEDDFGHGLKHVITVALDAGALVLIECRAAGYSEDFIRRRVTVIQCAGLLHDIRRKQKNHAVIGAEYARNILKAYPFQPDEVEDICQAIRNHEAFKDPVIIDTPESRMISDCIYDADKFRWGPDNFTDTVWHMVSFYKTPLSGFINYYPQGMEKLAQIRDTFRSATGKKYGPQFIDIGIAIGTELYDVIKKEFSDH